MNVFEFLLALTGGQWLGVLFLAIIAMFTVVGTAEQLHKIFTRNKQKHDA